MRILKIVIGFILLLALSFGARLGYNLLIDNVHTVIPGKIYRSAQFDHAAWKKYSKKLKIKSVINLRGSWPTNHWYQVESRFAKTHHLHYYPIQFSAYQLPAKKQLQKLVRLLQTVPQPLIFHCDGGADRTGLAAEISLILYDKNATITQIRRQASWRYNAISPRTVGYQVMRNYLAWLKVNHLASSKKHFLEWVNGPAKMKPYYGWFVG